MIFIRKIVCQSVIIIGIYISEEVLMKIESTTSEKSRCGYIEYMKENPWIAKRRGINIRNS